MVCYIMTAEQVSTSGPLDLGHGKSLSLIWNYANALTSADVI